MTILRRLTGAATLVAFFVAGTAHATPPTPSDAQADRAAIARIKPVHYKDLCSATSGYRHCMAKVVTDATGNVIHPDVAQGIGPTEIHAAYGLPMSGGGGKTVGIVDAYDAPNAEADLAVYRQQYGLPPCTSASGCFKKVNQTGGSTPPGTDGQGPNGWEGEIMLDIEMVSATCPDCKILLVEANNANDSTGFDAALQTATSLGAVAISNSYGGPEDSTVPGQEQYYHQPGILVTASAGDQGYGASYPATSAYVLAVGGTSLTASGSSRGWAETAWSYAQGGGTGSGCSAFIPKPSYQKDPACSMRMEADVSAVGDPATGVATYDGGNWQIVGGTSASSPIVASAFVLLGLEKKGVDWVYQNTASFYDVTSGTNDPQGGAGCGNNYECVAGVGYDGPTGWGTPNGKALAGMGTPACTTNAQCTTPTAPVCAMGNCRACQADNECSGATPKCDTTSGACVACHVNSDCSASAPVCDATSHTCKGCSAKSDCSSGVCDTANGQCVQCQTTADCTSPQICDTANNTCVGCQSSTDCKDPNNPVCDPGAHTCGPTGGGMPGVDGGTCTFGCSGGGMDAGGNPFGGGGGGTPDTTGNGTTTTTSGCSASPRAAGFGATGFAGVLFGLAAFARKRSRWRG